MSGRSSILPTNLRSLLDRERNAAKELGITQQRAHHIIAITVIGQCLPDTIIRGGTAMALRGGVSGSRFSTDLDVLRDPSSVATLDDSLQTWLTAGWCGFNGTATRVEAGSPLRIPPSYRLAKYEVGLDYRGQRYARTIVEFGYPELDCDQRYERRMASDIEELFTRVGLEQPAALPVMSSNDQVAQKLHGCTDLKAPRVHDLVDIQLLVHEDDFALDLTAEYSVRLFSYRGLQVWPPIISVTPGWAVGYAEQADGLSVIKDVDTAVAWGNDLIAQLDDSR